MTRTCEICPTVFEVSRNTPKRRFCHKNCREKAKRQRATPLDKARAARAAAKYKSSAKGRLWLESYRKRDDVVAKQKSASLRWRNSPEGISYRRQMEQTPEVQAYRKEYRRSKNGKQLQTAAQSRYRMKEGLFMANERARVYGLTVEQLKAILDAGCYAPGCNWSGRLHIDHDHRCCNYQGSCGKCVRGALCPPHNLYLGHLEKDPSFASWVLSGVTLGNEVRREA